MFRCWAVFLLPGVIKECWSWNDFAVVQRGTNYLKIGMFRYSFARKNFGHKCEDHKCWNFTSPKLYQPKLHQPECHFRIRGRSWCGMSSCTVRETLQDTSHLTATCNLKCPYSIPSAIILEVSLSFTVTLYAYIHMHGARKFWRFLSVWQQPSTHGGWFIEYFQQRWTQETSCHHRAILTGL